jgi:hypothetical protein
MIVASESTKIHLMIQAGSFIYSYPEQCRNFLITNCRTTQANRRVASADFSGYRTNDHLSLTASLR